MHLEGPLSLLHALRREAQAARPGAASSPSGSAGPRPALAASICLASGKGGTGKSVVAASLAALLAPRGGALIVDADMGVGNAHLLHDVSPRRSFVDVVQGRCEVRDALTPCGGGVELIGAGSGVSSMAGLSAYELHLIASGLARLDARHAFTLVDSAAGISPQTVAFAAACDLALVVTTPDVTAMTDAYAFLKVLYARRRDAEALLLVNRVPPDPLEGSAVARHVAERIARVCEKFLDRAPRLLGGVPEDAAVARSLAARRPLVGAEPGSPAALALQALSVPLVDELAPLPRRGLGRSLARWAGFSSASA